MRLLHMPAMLFLKFPKATWQWNAALGRGIIGITPKLVRWYVDKDFQVFVHRLCFSVAADLAGTAHSFAGETLQVAFLDIMSWDASPDRVAQLGAYMSMSRVRRMEDICVVRAFPPTLLAQGDLPGPELLLEIMEKELAEEDLESAWKTRREPRRRPTQ